MGSERALDEVVMSEIDAPEQITLVPKGKKGDSALVVISDH